MKKIFVLVLIVLSASILFASQKIVLDDVSNPGYLTVHQERLYITDNTTVFIYSLKDLSFMNKFGEKGSDPGEFYQYPRKWIPSLNIFPHKDQLVILHGSRTSFFSKDGVFIKEIKSEFGGLFPIGTKYIGSAYANNTELTITEFYIVNSDFQEEKKFFQYKSPLQKGQKIDPLIWANVFAFRENKMVTKDSFYFPTHDGIIYVFDNTGAERYTIKPDYPKVAITEAIKKEFLEFFKDDRRFNPIHRTIQKTDVVQFPQHLPLLKENCISDGKLFLITSSKKDGKYETLVYDLKGKFLNNTFLPLIDKDLLDIYPFTIYKSKIYQVIKNKDNDWELIVSTID